MAAEKVNLAASGQVGFPRFLPPVAGKGGFPLKETSVGRPNTAFIHTLAHKQICMQVSHLPAT